MISGHGKAAPWALDFKRRWRPVSILASLASFGVQARSPMRSLRQHFSGALRLRFATAWGLRLGLGGVVAKFPIPRPTPGRYREAILESGRAH